MDQSDELFQQIDKDSLDILQRIMNDGTFDSVRQKVMEQLKQDVELKRTAQRMVSDSKALQTVEVTPANKKQVLDSIRKELEEQLLEEASRTAWSIMCSEGSEVAALIDDKVRSWVDKVHESLCALYEQHWVQAQASYAAQQQHQKQQQQLAGQPYHCMTSTEQQLAAPPPAPPYASMSYEYSMGPQQHPQQQYATAAVPEQQHYYHAQQQQQQQYGGVPVPHHQQQYDGGAPGPQDHQQYGGGATGPPDQQQYGGAPVPQHQLQYGGGAPGSQDYMYGQGAPVPQHPAYYDQQQPPPPSYGQHPSMQHGGYPPPHPQWHGSVQH